MSWVTNIILSIESLDSDEDEKAEEINQYFFKQGMRGFVSLEDPSLPKGWYAGEKYLESTIYLGVFNYLDLEALIKHIKSIDWPDPTSAQLLVKGQQ